MKEDGLLIAASHQIMFSILRIIASVTTLIGKIPGWINGLRTTYLRSRIHTLDSKVKTLEVKLKVKEVKQQLDEDLKAKTQSASLDDIDNHFNKS